MQRARWMRLAAAGAAAFLSLGAVACDEATEDAGNSETGTEEEAGEDNENVGDAPGEQDPLGESPTGDPEEEE